MSDDLVEKVARAIWKTREEMFPGYQRLSWEETIEIARKAATADALAALRVVREALAEPDGAMMDAWENYQHPPHHENRAATKQAAIWRAMLAASPLGRGV
jgi:hypothetical protein